MQLQYLHVEWFESLQEPTLSISPSFIPLRRPFMRMNIINNYVEINPLVSKRCTTGTHFTKLVPNQQNMKNEIYSVEC